MTKTPLRRLSRALLLGPMFLVAALAPLGCDDRSTAGTDEAQASSSDADPVCLTTSWPLESILRDLAQDDLTVRCVLPFGADARAWRPDRKVLQELAEADLICLQGAGLETWVSRASLPRDRRVVLAEPFREEWLIVEASVTHRHGNGETHTHQGVDPHVWLDPRLVGLMIRRAGDALARVRPDGREAIEARTVASLERLERIQADFDRLAEGRPGLRVLADHPSYAYLGRALGWSVGPLEGGELESADLLVFESSAALAEFESSSEAGRPTIVVDPGASCPISAEPIDLLDWLGELPGRLEAALR